jgi:hypothetical protein
MLASTGPVITRPLVELRLSLEVAGARTIRATSLVEEVTHCFELWQKKRRLLSEMKVWLKADERLK